MKHTKELKAILMAIHCINFVSEHKDKDIYNLVDYAIQRCFEGNTNLISLCCIGHTKESLMPQINELLEGETQYLQFMRNKGK